MKSILQNLRDALHGYKKIHYILYHVYSDLKDYNRIIQCYALLLLFLSVPGLNLCKQPFWLFAITTTVDPESSLPHLQQPNIGPQRQSSGFSPHPHSSIPISISHPSMSRSPKWNHTIAHILFHPSHHMFIIRL